MQHAPCAPHRGLLVVSKKRNERMLELGSFFQKQGCQYDVICLQEVWVSADAEFLAQCGALAGFNHIHFKSGLFGSGLVTLSR